MSQYASNTSVSVENSRAEIERTLQRYGADAFMYGWSGRQAQINFAAHGRRIQFILTLPDKTTPAFLFTPGRGNERSQQAAYKEWEQACRQRWRALNLIIKAKLEAVESGVSEFEEEFLAHIVLPDGSRVGDWMRPQVDRAYETGKMPPMMPELGSGR